MIRRPSPVKGRDSRLGVRPWWYRYFALGVSGGLAGLGGVYLVTVSSSLYREGQTAGRVHRSGNRHLRQLEPVAGDGRVARIRVHRCVADAPGANRRGAARRAGAAVWRDRAAAGPRARLAGGAGGWDLWGRGAR